MQWAPPIHRFYEKVDMTSGECWQWIGGKKAAGYGQFSVEGKKVIAHRWAYAEFVGPIPDGHEIDHLCGNRSCVNPEHLEAVTLTENRQRRNDRKTACYKGHAFTPDNTRLQADSDGYTTRVCRTCERRRKGVKAPRV